MRTKEDILEEMGYYTKRAEDSTKRVEDSTNRIEELKQELKEKGDG